LGLVLLPVVVVLVLFGVKQVMELSRYDPAFFSGEYLERYETPGSVAIDLEQALREGDMQLMAELQATRTGPSALLPRSSLIFALLLSVEGDYFHYLYFDAADYSRVIEYVKERDGRYVASEPDFYFYMDSGRWRGVAAPIAAAWWSLVAVYTVATYIYRRMAVTRMERFGR
jgi:hypothetical protein